MDGVGVVDGVLAAGARLGLLYFSGGRRSEFGNRSLSSGLVLHFVRLDWYWPW